MLKIEYFQLHGLYVVQQFAYQTVFSVEYWVAACEEKEGCKFFHIAHNFLEEVVRKQETDSFCICRHFVIAYYLSFADNENIVRRNLVYYSINRVFNLSTRADSQQQAFHFRCFGESGQTSCRVVQQQIVLYAEAIGVFTLNEINIKFPHIILF